MYLKTGESAPEFSLPDQNGSMVSLKDFSRNKLVLWFFPKANTPGWTLEGKGFRDEFEKFQDLHVSIIGVSADTSAKLKKFEEKFNFPFLLLETIKTF